MRTDQWRKFDRYWVKAYVPEGLELPSECPVQREVWYFLGVLFWKQLDRERYSEWREREFTWDEFANLKYDYLNRLPGRWNEVWKWCVKLDLVERTRDYVPGVRAYGYRLAEPWRGRRHDLQVFSHEQIAKKTRRRERENLGQNATLKNLRSQLERLTVDMGEYRLYSGQHPHREFYDAQLRTIDDRCLRLTKDRFSGRIHTNITNLCKPLRAYLRADGEASMLAEIDIRNSQPLFLGLAAKQKGHVNHDYLRLCEDGLLYDRMAEQLNMTRDVAKKNVMVMLYADRIYPTPQQRWFEENFPEVSDYVNNVRAQGGGTMLAKRMQQAERKLIITEVCPRLFRRKKSTFVTTIHDSLMTKQEDAEMALETVQEAFSKRGVSPRLDVNVIAAPDMRPTCEVQEAAAQNVDLCPALAV
ncbi:hypothetical protein [Blastopirellula marina]|uniref:DNA-directed DNA polymerase family A palm domain-containing protein n=1 Tax=Blastopirellula marina TaxID=124 RepID=A0A2S8GCU6_9BACT|nr:hypothetical protein [Blastopirellula marina]PQO42295.1 hypothetical protein C5Y93_28555 [Blastopirellula marina]